VRSSYRLQLLISGCIYEVTSPRYALRCFATHVETSTPSASHGLAEIVSEVKDLPTTQQRAVIMDCLLDLSFESEDWQTVSTTQDAVLFVKKLISLNVNIEPADELRSFEKDLASKLDLAISAQSISSTERLVKALERAAIDNDDPTRQNMVVSGNRMFVRVPNFPDDNLGMVDNLGKLLRWATTVLQMKNPEIKILKDPSLGNSIQLQAKVERMIDNTIAAMTLPPGETGDRAEFKTGFKANLVELLAAVRLLRRYQPALQKGVAPKGKKITPISLEDLRNSINGRAGIKEHGINPFTSIFVKLVFSELTKPSFANFPGKWINSLKVSNGVKNNTGVIYKMGYELTVANPQKVLTVVKTDVREKEQKSKTSEPKKKKTEKDESSNIKHEVYIMDDKTAPEGCSHQEFRLGCMMLMPLIDPRDKKSPKDQLSTDPISVRDKTVLGFYKKNRDVVDALNLAYAIKSSLGKKDSKSTVLGYQSARGHAISLSANRVFMDASGKEYQKYHDIPDHVKGYLEKLLFRKMNSKDQEESHETPPEEKKSGDKTPPSDQTKTT